MTHYHIAGFANRGSADDPFGRIYLTVTTKKDAEIIGSLGCMKEDNDKLAIWRSNQTPDDTSRLTYIRAQKYLAAMFPKLSVVIEQ